MENLAINIVDITIVTIIVISLLIGYVRGFIREVVSLTSWLGSLWAAFYYNSWGAALLEPYIDQPLLRVVAAFCALFIVALIAFSIVGYFVYRAFALAHITGVNHSLGMLFGVVRGVLVVSILILLAAPVGLTAQAWWRDSLLVPHLAPAAELVYSLAQSIGSGLPRDLPGLGTKTE